MVNKKKVEIPSVLFLFNENFFFLVRNEIQTKYPQLAVNQPFLSIDFGNGPLAGLTNGGRLFDVHKNLPSKGTQLVFRNSNERISFSQRW